MPLLVLRIQRTNLNQRLARQYQRIHLAYKNESEWLRTSGEPIEIMKMEIFKTISALKNIHERIKIKSETEC